MTGQDGVCVMLDASGPNRKTRSLILLWAGILLAGGVWKAAQALGVGSPALPLQALTMTAEQLAAQRGPATPLHALACAPSLHLSLVQLAAAPRLLLPGTLLAQQLHPSLAAVPLVPPINVTTAALLHPPPLPASLLRRLQPPGSLPPVRGAVRFPAASLEPGFRTKLVRHAVQLLELVLETNQLPPPAADHASAVVLLHVSGLPPSPDAVPQQQLKSDSSGRSSGDSAGLSGKSAALVTAVGLPGKGVLAMYVTGWQGMVSNPNAHKLLLGQIAATISNWLGASIKEAAEASQLGKSPGDPLREASSNVRGDACALGSTCLAGAGALLGQFVAAQRALPHAHISPELAQLAVHSLEAASTAQHVQQGSGNDITATEALSLARAAWAVAWALQHHPGFGVEPVFPAEHQLAVLLPLSLPIALVLLRAVAGEVKAWRGERRAAAAACRSKKEA